MSIICKFFKRVTCIFDKTIWSIAQWDKTFLNRFDIDDWELSKIIISNKDKKFISNFWAKLFRQLKVKFFYFTIYHSQIDEQFKRTNQTMKIALRFAIVDLDNFVDWSNVFLNIQREINNFSTNINKNSNEIFYDFISMQFFDLILQKFFAIDTLVDFYIARRIIRSKTIDAIAFNQIYFKIQYNKKHQFFFMKIDDWTLLRFHKSYKISIIARLKKKYSQQYFDFFRIIEKIDRLTYRFAISKNWKIHFVFIVVQLKFCSFFDANSYVRLRFTKSNFVFVEKNIDKIKSFEIKRLIDKRSTTRDIEYLIRWREYESQHDVWKNLSKLDNVINFVQNYESTIFLSKRFQFFFSRRTKKSFAKFASMFVDQKFVVVVFKKFFANDFILFSHSSTNKLSFKNSFISFIEILILYVDFVLKFSIIDFFSLVNASTISRRSFRRFVQFFQTF